VLTAGTGLDALRLRPSSSYSILADVQMDRRSVVLPWRVRWAVVEVICPSVRERRKGAPLLGVMNNNNKPIEADLAVTFHFTAQLLSILTSKTEDGQRWLNDGRRRASERIKSEPKVVLCARRVLIPSG